MYLNKSICGDGPQAQLTCKSGAPDRWNASPAQLSTELELLKVVIDDRIVNREQIYFNLMECANSKRLRNLWLMTNTLALTKPVTPTYNDMQPHIVNDKITHAYILSSHSTPLTLKIMNDFSVKWILGTRCNFLCRISRRDR